MARTEAEKAQAKAEAEAAMRALETDEERAAREQKEAEEEAAHKPRRGRPPGTTNKPKISEEALRAGCISLVKFLWVVSALPAKIAGGTLAELTKEEVEEGAAQAEGLVKRYGWLVVAMTVVGFPLWMVRMFTAKFHRKPTPKLAVVNDPNGQKRA